MLADLEFCGAYEVADVLDENHVKRGEIQPLQRVRHHRRVEVAFPTEAVACVQKGNLGPESIQAVGIERGFNVTLDDAVPGGVGGFFEDPADEFGLACPRRAHQVNGHDPRRVERCPVGIRLAVIFTKDIFEHIDSLLTRVIARVIPVFMLVCMFMTVVMLMFIVMNMFVLDMVIVMNMVVGMDVVAVLMMMSMNGSVVMAVETSH